MSLCPGGGAKTPQCRHLFSWSPRRAGYAQLRMRPPQIRNVEAARRAAIGEVGAQQSNINWARPAAVEAGVRPTARGVVMNPVDHPHVRVV